MMMLNRLNWKSRLNLICLMGAWLFVSCSGDDEGNPFGDWNQDFSVRFSSGLSDWTVGRAANGSWNEGDKVGIYMIPHVAEASAAADFSSKYAGTASNIPYLTSAGGESAALSVVSGTNAILYPIDGSRVNFVAYSPYRAETHTTNANVYKVDVSNQSPSNHIDLLYYKGVGTAYDKNSKDAKLAFTHQLSKMKVSLVPASDVAANLTGASLTLTGFPATADFNLSTGVLSGLGGTIKSISPVKDAASSSSRAAFEAIIVPHTGTPYTRSVTFRINDTNYGYLFPASATFKAGVVHNYNFKFTGAKVEPAQELVSYGDGGTVSWGDYQLTAGKFSFDLAAGRTSGNTVTLSTNAPSALIYTLSNDAETNTGVPDWMTGVSLSNPTPSESGWNSYTLTFNTDYNINSDAVSRTGYIRLEVAGIMLPIRVTQAANALYVHEPEPASFENLAVGGKTGNTFTLTTNAQNEEITVIASNTSWITNLTKSRSAVATDGSSTWTIGFDVSANTTTDARSGSIEVTIGGIKKTIPVSQAGIHVDEPDPASFPDLAAGGKTGNTFTLTTNIQDESITVTTKASWITKLTKTRSAVATDGSYTWTIGFDVSANTTTSSRSGTIEVTVGGQKKTVSVSQVAMYVEAPSPASFDNLAVGGVTGNTFTITTNAPDESITVTTKSSWITNLTKTRSAATDDGSYTWTISFDVSANTTTSDRSGTIEVTIGGQKKTVNISQVAAYTNAPIPAKIENVIAAGETGKTFTIETNSTAIVPTSLTTTNTSMITNLNAERSVKDAVKGIYLWTVTFDVSANTTTSERSASVSINIGGITKTVSVSQVAMSVYVNEPNPALFSDLAVGGLAGNTFTITTNVRDESITVTCPTWITKLTKTRSPMADDGSYTWTISFDVSKNTTASPRSGAIEVTIGGQKKTVNVSQVAMYVNEPSTASFPDLAVGGVTGNTFTIATNAPDESITVTTKSSWITNLTKTRSAVTADGSSVWTISFDVTENTTTSDRSGQIEVTISGIKKTITVSQVAMYVGAPSPNSFVNLAVGGETGKTFTITTNAPDENITVSTTNTTMIVNLSKSRGEVATDGSSVWTISFDVTANTNTSTRSGNIEVTIGGQKKTVNVSQVAVYTNVPVPAKIENVIAAGEMGKTFTIETNSTAIVPTSLTTTNTSMITNLNAERSVKDAVKGIYLWTVTFDVSVNTTTSARSATVSINIGGITKTVSVSQVPIYVNDPAPAKIENVNVTGETGKTFTVETNSTAIVPTSLTATDISMITNLSAERSVKDAVNDIYLWTVTFDVSANTTTSARSASVSINIGGITKTVSVSQVAMPVYVNEPDPASFPDLAVGGLAGNTFTITTNAPNESVTATTNTSWITNLTKTRSTVATDGSYVWTIAFDVSANMTTSARSGNIEVTIGGQKKTVTVSQVAMYVDEPNPASFPDLAVSGKTGNTFTIATNAPDESITVNSPTWITNLTKTRGTVAADGSCTWTISFDVSANTTTSSRSGNIEVIIGGQKKTVSVSQIAMYVGAPSPNSFVNLAVGGETGKTFTITTNAQEEDIAVTTTNTTMIANLSKSRGAVATDGSSTWSIGFDVTANTNTSPRSGNIEVTISGQKKTVNVSQVAMYLNTPNPASFNNVIAAGRAGNTFTIDTNAQDNDITVNSTNPSLITNLTKSRGTVAADGSSTWTIGFDVTANTNTSTRSGNIEVTINDITKTVSVSQVAMYISEPNPASVDNLAVGGVTGNTFTITTNSTATIPTSLTTTDPLMITNLNAVRSVQDAANGIYLWTVTFDVSENTTPSLRSAIVSITIGSITKTVPVLQTATTWNLPPTNTVDGLANCYMVVPGGTVTFPITRAITIGGMSALANVTAETLWDDNSVISGNPTLSGSGASRIITINTLSTKGNAVIALKDATGTIYWSWHIWVVDYDPNTNNWTNPNNPNLVFMDRNLGATDNQLNLASRGLFYQWGRKDPFPGGKAGTAGYAALSSFKGIGIAVTVPNTSTNADGITAGMQESIRKPTTFFSSVSSGYNWLPASDDTLWNTLTNEKTVYDPCPNGWRIQTTEKRTGVSWSNLIFDSYVHSGDHGGSTAPGGLCFPHCGKRDHTAGTWIENYREGDSHYELTWLASFTGHHAVLWTYGRTGSGDGHLYLNAPSYGFPVRCVRE